MASLLDPISDRVRGNVILLGEVGGADVILQHFPHDPSALLQGKGRSIDGAAGIDIGFGPWALPVLVGNNRVYCRCGC